MEIKEIFYQFLTEETMVSAVPYGNGHINHTFLVQTQEGPGYILQKINTDIFSNTDELMENIVNVTSWLKKADPNRQCLTVIRTRSGRAYFTDPAGGKWRMYEYVKGARAYDMIAHVEDFGQIGLAFGEFQAMLSDFPAKTLHETIPDFHNTPKRYKAFEKALEEDVKQRAAEVTAEIAFLRERRGEMELPADRKLPLRVTHNDTKINNILLDEKTRKPVCVIDLDTVMPGLSIFDFGDAIRSGANTAEENEPDLSKVSLSLELYEIFTRGFIKGCGGRLTREELELLPMGAKIMTLECGMRFLTDYLQGDTYFHTSRPGENLDRCRNQFALAADMEKKWQEMCGIVSRCSTDSQTAK